MGEIKRNGRLVGWLLPLALLACSGCWGERKEDRLDALIIHAAQEYEVAPALVKAVIWRESRFDPGAKGRDGEIGLMQIRALAAREWAEAEKVPSFRHYHLYDPQKNMRAGTWYLGKLLKRYQGTDDPVPYALADYNAGRQNVLRWNDGEAATHSAKFLEQIDFPGTKAYINVVMERYHHYRERMEDR